jgi:hypothetical protein
MITKSALLFILAAPLAGAFQTPTPGSTFVGGRKFAVSSQGVCVFFCVTKMQIDIMETRDFVLAGNVWKKMRTLYLCYFVARTLPLNLFSNCNYLLTPHTLNLQ